jgi:lipopolysaccharide assembly outer membrane protein LptD (OstA)
MIGKLDHSMSESSLGAFYAAATPKALSAMRTVRCGTTAERLAKYTYFYNVPTTDQVTIQNTAVEFIQKSHITSLDLSYDLTAKWSLGSKYAYRLDKRVWIALS